MRVEADVSTGRSLAWTFAASGLSLALLLLVALTGHDLHGHVSGALYAGGAAVVIALSFLALTRGRRRTERRLVGADARGLSLDGALVAPRAAIRSARVVESADGTPAVFVGTRGLVPVQTIHVPSGRLAQAIVDELERPPEDVVEFRALPPWAHRMRLLAVVLTTSPWVILNLLRFMPAFMIAVTVGLYALLGLPMLLPRRVRVGEDGLLLRWAGRDRFVPYDRVLAARVSELGVELDLTGGEVLDIRLGHRADAQARSRDEMRFRIEEGLQTHRAREPAEDAALLARGERTLATWIADSDALGRNEGGSYRALAIPRARLWAVLENPRAETSAREGAALALRAQLADEERPRLGRIAEKTASPRLRVTLDAVAAGPDESELRVALDDERTAVDDGERVRRRAQELS